MLFIISNMRSLFKTITNATLRDVGLVCLADGIVGISFGAISVSGGLPPWFPIALSLLVFAGGAQFATVGVLLAGGDPLTAAATGLALNGRLVAYGFTVSEVLGQGRIARLLGSHFILDESVAFAMKQTEPDAKRAAFWASGIMIFVVWNLAVLAGALAGKSIGNASSFGLDAAFPALLFALVLPALSNKTTRHHALGGCLVATISTQLMAPGLSVLAALLVLVPSAWRSRIHQLHSTKTPS
ncbi:AzlC family ABC transporter permease [Rhodoferax sp.]|uniref:AzlC family ABC transporter permease n=1 Tax=Rhodoferax sp. TaxID=50421 RepID=UPI00284B532D|nr:AzlC family ABC transporter permease [Rhodoferax sp.]MDR3372052.1 AzlC family ABC transporter permease [Rhodoferax sp.]